MKRALMALVLFAGLAQAGEPVVDFFRAVPVDDDITVKALLSTGFDVNMLDPMRREPALVIAVREEANNVFQILLAHPGIKVDQAASNGNTALMLAAYKHNRAALEALIAKGAAINKSGWSPLHYAAASGDVSIATRLLELKADINALAPGDLTPLMIAAREGQEDVLRLLLERGADTSLKSGEKLTALQIAERADKAYIVRILSGR